MSLHLELQLQFQIWDSGQVLPPISKKALIDSGAGNNFMDSPEAQILCLSIQPKAIPDLVETVQGSLLSSGPISQETTDVCGLPCPK